MVFNSIAFLNEFLTPRRWREQRELLETENVISGIGVHPNETPRYLDDPDRVDETIHSKFMIQERAGKPFRFFGEIGLDTSDASRPGLEFQIPSLVRLLRLAETIEPDIPLVFHCRGIEASLRLPHVLRDYLGRKRPIVLHCCRYPLEWARRIMGDFENAFVSISPLSLTDGKSAVELVKGVPGDRILVESDAPYLASGLKNWNSDPRIPPGLKALRGRNQHRNVNQPFSILGIIKWIGSQRGWSELYTLQRTACNSQNWLGVPLW